MSYHNNYTPPRRTPATPTPPPAQEQNVERQVDSQIIVSDESRTLDRSRPPYVTDTSVAQKTSVSTESLNAQVGSKFYLDSSRSQVSEESATYFEYLESKGVVFTIFAEEEVYFRNFTKSDGERGSYPSSQTARYHFVEMATPGKTLHNFSTPLSNGNMRNAHPELTDEKIDSMRAAFNQNQSIRPFSFPVQVRNASPSDIEKLRQNQMQLFSYVNKKSPLNVLATAPYERPNLTRGFSSRTSNGTVPYMSVQKPRAAENGDLWFDQKHGRLYVFMSLVSGSFWVEV